MSPEPTPDTTTEPALSCRDCGACCRDSADGTVLVSAADLVRWRREKATTILDGLVPGHFGQDGFRSRPDGSCIHLGMPGHPNDCSIYETRAETCHALVVGSSQCLMYRRLAGVPPVLG